MPYVETQALSATWGSAGTKSDAVDCYRARDGASVVDIEMPATFTGATISFEVSHNGTTFQPLYKIEDNSLISYTVTQGRSYTLDPAILAGWRYVKVVSASSEASGRVVILIARVV